MTRLVDAQELAAAIGTSRDYVYEHQAELGVIRLGTGPKARLRFDVETALERLSACTTGRQPEQPEPPQQCRSRARCPQSLGTTVELLPIRRSRRAA